jgi:hypothetical protein
MSPSGLLASFFSFNTRNAENSSISSAWPTSPNITANRKGKVTMVSSAGLASR